jgi:hypothetical protein
MAHPRGLEPLTLRSEVLSDESGQVAEDKEESIQSDPLQPSPNTPKVSKNFLMIPRGEESPCYANATQPESRTNELSLNEVQKEGRSAVDPP